MSETHNETPIELILSGKPLPRKNRFIVPFIGIFVHEYGQNTPVAGMMCAHKKETIFWPVESADPLRCIRAFMLLSEIGEFTESMVKDCVIATKNERRHQNFSCTDVCNYHGDYKSGRFLKAQKRAMDFEPKSEIIQQVIDGFAAHLVPLAALEPLGHSSVETESSYSGIHFEKPEAFVVPPGPAQNGFFYGPLAHSTKNHLVPQSG